MALLELAGASPSTLRAVGDGWLETMQQRWESSVMLWPEGAQDWPVGRLEELTEAHFEPVLATSAQVVLLGSGARLRFPDPRLLGSLRRLGIGVEVMDHHAAARTFNLLLAEGRRVTALFLIEDR